MFYNTVCIVLTFSSIIICFNVATIDIAYVDEFMSCSFPTFLVFCQLH